MKVQLDLGGRTVTATLEGDEIHIGGHAFRVTASPAGILVDGSLHHVEEEAVDVIRVNGTSLPVRIGALEGFAGVRDPNQVQFGPFKPPMSGTVLEVLVKEGDVVAAGDTLFVLEAMKMQNEIRTTGPARIGTVHVQPGTPVGSQDAILELEPISDA